MHNSRTSGNVHPTLVCAHMHTCKRTHTHTCFRFVTDGGDVGEVTYNQLLYRGEIEVLDSLDQELKVLQTEGQV